MGRKYQWKTRFGSAILAASMLSTILPFQVIAAAVETEDEKPVSVRWEPQTQTEDGKVNVDLTVELNPQDGSTLTAAMVEISLDSEEAAALQWNGTSISVSELGTQEDDENQDSDETTTITPPATEEGKHETDTTQPSEGTVTPSTSDGTGGTTPSDPEEETDETDTTQTPEGTVTPDTGDGTGGTTPSDTGDGTGGDTQSDPEEETDETDTTQTTTTTTPGADGGTDETATTTPDETSAQLLTVPEARSDTGDPSAVLIKKEDGGAVLRILAKADNASGENPAYERILTFENTDVEDGQLVDVGNSDIQVQTYSEETELPDIKTAELLTATDTDDVLSLTASQFTVYADIPDEIAVTTDREDGVNLDGTGEEANKDATYTIKIRKTAVTDKDGKAYTFAVTLPTGLSLPAGEITLENGSIKCGETEIASLNLPEGLTLKEESLQKNEDTGFTFTVTVPQVTDAEPVDVHTITLTLRAGALVRTPDTVTGNITLTVSAGEETEPVSADVSVNAKGATLPGDGGWRVNVTEQEDKTQHVFWRDNEETASRPGELGDNNDAAYWKNNAKLYYTLSDEDGTVYERVQLTQENYANLGLTAYPTFTADASGFTVQDLPTEIQLVNPNEPYDVIETYTVSWSMEPPDKVEHYAFRDIKASEIGEGNTYPSLEEGAEGWYYMLEDTFTFTLEVRQGDETINENDVRELLNQFQFNWSYTGGEGSASVADLLDDKIATYNYDPGAGTVTITGMWKYNVDGSPIKYTITEKDENPNYEIPAEDLKPGPGLVDEGDWYQIHYNNAGVSGDGQDTTALYSGGTLQLVRQGNTEYKATKIWLDSYGDAGERPTAEYTLYRYIEGYDPSTVSQLTEYKVIAVSNESGEGGEGEETTTGGLTLQVYAADAVDENGNIKEGAQPVQLPKYDTQGGAEFIYVVRETLSGDNAGQYEQVFGTVEVVDGEVVYQYDTASLPEGTSREGNTYLYNDGTLTNYQKGTIPVTATKTWNAAAYQSKFDNVAVELTLQYRVKDDPSSTWQYYPAGGDEDDRYVRYLHNFYAESLSDSLEEVPSMPQYATTNGKATTLTTNQELEYRWLETAVYTDAGGATATSPGEGAEEIKIVYKVGEEDTSTTGDPQGSFTMGDTQYTVSYEGGENNTTQITNKVSEYLNYNVVKEWHGNSLETNNGQPITIQILRSVAGGDFEPYLKFTMEAKEGKVTVTGPTTKPSDANPTITGDSVTTGTGNNDPKQTWNATVHDLPRFDEQGRPYEYLLLEADHFPIYETTIDEAGNITTRVINGDDGGGFNLLVRKVWLDDGDAEHRGKVTFTLYNRKTSEPVMRKEGDGVDDKEEPYTIELGGENEENLWHKVVRIGLSTIDKGSEGEEIKGADDVYLVETSLGENKEYKVNYNLEDGQNPSFEYLYPDEAAGEQEQTGDNSIFDVKTDHHRYQVSYTLESATELLGENSASFTITNRRLGNIDVQVTKKWKDGRAGEASAVVDEIQEVLKSYAEKDTYLALAFRLNFDASMEKTEETDTDEWEITRNNPSGDTVTVGENAGNVPIYSEYADGFNPDNLPDNISEDTDVPDYEARYDFSSGTSSDQIILGWTKPSDGNTLTEENWVEKDEASFLGLPKYDTDGNVVAYSVEEVWLKLGDDGKYEVVTLSENTYPALYELWKDFSDSYEPAYKPNQDGKHTWDIQTMAFTNTRGGTKNVSWTVEWQDDFTNNSNLRPDIYLDVYRVTYKYDKNGNRGEPVIERVTNTVDWTKEENNSWTATVSGVPAYDDYGHEFYYYAVERTVMSAGDYDYQAAKYQMGEGEDATALGTRDEAAEDEPVLNGEKTSITDDENQPYNLLVLGKANESDPEDSIAWSPEGSGPDNIGDFNPAPGSEGNYPKYALLEGGTIINTLANTFSIEGVKYWTGLPANWNTESRLPGVTFNVYRSTEPATETGSGEGETEEKTPVAKLVISSDLWKDLQVGTQYRYLIQYEGINVLAKEAGDENDNGVSNEIYVEAVYAMDTDLTDETAQPLTDPTRLPRYEEGTGKLWHYTVEEEVDYGENGPEEDDVFESYPSGFTFTNKYAPTTGTIEVKKYLYLPMKDDGTPASYPAVTFRLERWLEVEQSTEDAEHDESSGKYYIKDVQEDVTLTTEQVQAIWTEEDDDGVLNGSGNTATVIAHSKGDGYISATLRFSDLPLYAPDGTEYQYSISEVKTYLNGYDTWGQKGDVEEPENGFTGEKLTVTNGVTDPIQFLTPTESETAEGDGTGSDTGDNTSTTTTSNVDATFKNQRETSATYKAFTATKIWDDDNDASKFRPTPDKFKELLTLTRTASKQGVTGGAAEIVDDELVQGEDYTIKIEEDSTDNNKWTITITPKDGEFEKYAPNGMPWTYTLSEPIGENGRLQIIEVTTGDAGNTDGNGGTEADDTDPRNNIYTPSTPNDKADGTWENTINDQSEPVGGDNNTYSFGELTNSIMTLAKFEKKWVGADDKPISADYLDFDLTVEFQLQVRESGRGEWTNASVWTYNNGTDPSATLGLSEDTNSLTGQVVGAKHNWTYTFEDLPSAIKVGDNYIFLEYRVIETKVSWDENAESQNQTIDLPEGETSKGDRFDYTVSPDNSLVTGAEFERTAGTNTSITTNTLDTTSVSVTKVWSDGSNQYNTRPGAAQPWSWESWFVLQRSTTRNDEDSWEEVALFKLLYGSNAEDKSSETQTSAKWEDTISGLPTIDENGKKYHYRVRELQPPESGSYTLAEVTNNIVDDNGIYNLKGYHYNTTYEESTDTTGKLWTVTNTLDTDDTEKVPENIEVIKEWAGEDRNGGIQSVTFQLQYQTEDSEWAPAEFLTNNQHEKTATADDWTVSWNGLPATDNSGNAITGYRVIEVSGTGWVQIAEPTVEYAEDTNTTTYSYTFTNSIVTSFSVEKTWIKDSAPAGVNVKVGLYRTTDKTKVGDTEGEPVPVDEMDNPKHRTVTLDGTKDGEGGLETEEWQATFTNLPKYDATGDPYYYYALELDEAGNPIAANGSISFDGSNFHVDYTNPEYKEGEPTDGNDSTTIINTPATSITGTKTWVDNGGIYNTRPGDLTLNLYRTTDTSLTDESWIRVDLATEGIEFKWTAKEGNQWTYTFSNLPKYDAYGKLYTYKVTETVPTGYKEANNGAGVAEEGATNFTNTLTGTVTINGTKSWQGGTGTKPDLTLERRLAGSEGEWTEVEVTEGQPTWDELLTTYTYTGLDKYNEDGVLYEYRVTEKVPDGYDVYYENGTASNGNNTNGTEPDVENMAITNVKRGELTVTKQVTGNRGEYDRQFDFKVTFTLPNDYEEADNTVPKITITKNGVEQPSKTFSGGTATVSFTLADEESITFSNLPGNTHYVVEETNPYGHTIISQNDSTGEIPPGSTATAEFTNHKNYSGGGGGGDPENPPDEDIPDEPTPDEDIPPDEPDVPDEPDEPDNPDNPDEPDEPDEDIPDEPTPGEDVPPDEPSTPGEPGTPGTPGTPSEPGLPQTGQLWWPVGLLIAAGAAMIVTGVWNLKRYRGKHGKKKV